MRGGNVRSSEYGGTLTVYGLLLMVDEGMTTSTEVAEEINRSSDYVAKTFRAALAMGWVETEGRERPWRYELTAEGSRLVEAEDGEAVVKHRLDLAGRSERGIETRRRRAA